MDYRIGEMAEHKISKFYTKLTELNVLAKDE
jgi:hypothetical protein